MKIAAVASERPTDDGGGAAGVPPALMANGSCEPAQAAVLFTAHDRDRDVVGAAAQIGQVDHDLRGVGQGQALQQNADFFVGDLAAEPVAAQQERVAHFKRERAFQIDLHFGVRAEGTGDDVFGNKAGQGIFGNLTGGRHFPNETVIESELVEALSAEAIDAAVADVCHECPLRQNGQHAGGGAHSLEVEIGLAAMMDLMVGFDDAFAEGIGSGLIGEL